MKNACIFICLLFLTTQLFAQTETTFKNNITLDLGYNQGYVKDLNFSQLNYAQGGILLGLTYQKNSANKKNRIEGGVHLSTGTLKTDASSYFTSDYTLVTLDAAFLRKINPLSDSKLSYFLGGQYKSNIQYFDWRSQQAISFLATHGIAIKGLVAYQLSEKQGLESSLTVPLFQILVRPSYNTIDNFVDRNQDNLIKLATTGKPSTLDTYRSIEWKTRFKYALSKRFDLSIAYGLHFQHVPSAHKLTQLNNQFSTGFTFKF
jgi:hypothetical protein